VSVQQAKTIGIISRIPLAIYLENFYGPVVFKNIIDFIRDSINLSKYKNLNVNVSLDLRAHHPLKKIDSFTWIATLHCE
jgi:hypothetical protein